LGSTERTSHKYTCTEYLHISTDEKGFVNRDNKNTHTEKTVRKTIKLGTKAERKADINTTKSNQQKD